MKYDPDELRNANERIAILTGKAYRCLENAIEIADRTNASFNWNFVEGIDGRYHEGQWFNDRDEVHKTPVAITGILVQAEQHLIEASNIASRYDIKFRWDHERGSSGEYREGTWITSRGSC